MNVNQQEDLLNTSWNRAWSSVTFKKKFVTVSVLFLIVLLAYPYFFSFIQSRDGVQLHDLVLQNIPSLDMSAYIFGLIYITVFVGIVETARYPYRFLVFLWCCLLLSLVRMTTITLIPLEPPIGLVPLIDPILKPFYRDTQITKDLFFSGHTSSMVLIYLMLRKNWQKALALVATIAVAVLLLFQHIHYFIDVVAAPIFVYFIVAAAKKIASAAPLDTSVRFTSLQKQRYNN